eukprot:gene20185-biopygen7045
MNGTGRCLRGLTTTPGHFNHPNPAPNSEKTLFWRRPSEESYRKDPCPRGSRGGSGTAEAPARVRRPPSSPTRSAGRYRGGCRATARRPGACFGLGGAGVARACPVIPGARNARPQLVWPGPCSGLHPTHHHNAWERPSSPPYPRARARRATATRARRRRRMTSPAPSPRRRRAGAEIRTLPPACSVTEDVHGEWNRVDTPKGAGGGAAFPLAQQCSHRLRRLGEVDWVNRAFAATAHGVGMRSWNRGTFDRPRPLACPPRARLGERSPRPPRKIMPVPVLWQPLPYYGNRCHGIRCHSMATVAIVWQRLP